MRGIVRKDSLDENLKAARRKLDSLGLSVSAVILFAVLAVIGLVALFAPILAPYDPNDQNLTARLEPPSLDHPLGTDHLGRDVLSRLLVGSRFSLAITTVSVMISGVFGTLVGPSREGSAARRTKPLCVWWT